MDRYISLLKKYSGFDTLVKLSMGWPFPGHRKISVHDVIAFFLTEIRRDAINVRAASVAFSLFVSLFPTLLVVFTIIPYLPLKSFQVTMLTTMEEVMPDNVYDLLHTTIEDIVLNHRAELLSISLVLAFYYSSQGVISLMNSFDKTLPTFRRRNFWEKQLVSFKLMGLLTLLLTFSVVLIIGGEFLVKVIMKALNTEDANTYFWFSSLRWLTILLIFYLSISLIYFYGPATHKRWQFFTAGSTLATVLSILVSLLFSWVIDKFGQYNKLYGSIGTILVTQLWIYYNALSLLIGFELNASIEINERKIIEPQS